MSMTLGAEAAPGAPNAGEIKLYTKGDGVLYYKDENGTEKTLDGQGGGGGEKRWTITFAASVSQGGAFLTPTTHPVSDSQVQSIVALAVNVSSNFLNQPLNVTVVIDGSPTLLTAQYNAFETGVKTVTNLALSGIALGTVVSIDIQTADGFNFATLDVSVTFSTLGGQ